MIFNNFSFFLIFSLLFTFSDCFAFKVTDEYKKYCFKKYIREGDKLTLSFVISSDETELVNANLTYQKSRTEPKILIYKVIQEELGNYVSEAPEKEGIYEVCIEPKDGKEFHVSMVFSSLFEERNINNIVTDTEMKKITEDMNEVRTDFELIEMNMRHLNNRNYRHLEILQQFIKSIERMTYLKIFIIALSSLFQIFIIQKLFGPDKRHKKIVGTFSEKGSDL